MSMRLKTPCKPAWLHGFVQQGVKSGVCRDLKQGCGAGISSPQLSGFKRALNRSFGVLKCAEGWDD